MLIVGVLCVVAALAALTVGVRTLRRPDSGDPEQQVLRAIAPAQLAVGVILGAGGAVAIAGPPQIALLAVFICITGALGTLAAGSWQGARYAARQQAEQELLAATAAASGGGCGGECGCAGGGAGPEAAPEAAVPAAPAPLPEALLGSIMLSGTTGGGGCGDGCGCSGGAPAAAPENGGGCGSGCGCG